MAAVGFGGGFFFLNMPQCDGVDDFAVGVEFDAGGIGIGPLHSPGFSRLHNATFELHFGGEGYGIVLRNDALWLGFFFTSCINSSSVYGFTSSSTVSSTVPSGGFSNGGLVLGLYLFGLSGLLSLPISISFHHLKLGLGRRLDHLCYRFG